MLVIPVSTVKGSLYLKTKLISYITSNWSVTDVARCFVYELTAARAARVKLLFSSDNLFLHEIFARKLPLATEASGVFLSFKINSTNTV